MAKKIVDPKPFLRWAGGKQWFVSEIEKFLPKKFNNYHEPFLGGGSIFIHLKAKGLIKNKAYLSDLNGDLINSYISIRDNANEVVSKLRKHENRVRYYYDIRDKRFSSKTSRAAQFIYLNRASYNGIYRVNLKGEYNVPYGYKKYSEFVDAKNIRNLAKMFKSVYFKKQDFYKSLRNIKQGDLVFLDPPYTVAHDLNGFVKYNQKIFQWTDQKRLRKFIAEIKKRKAKFILTNAAHESIERLYRTAGDMTKKRRYSVIGGTNAKRNKYSELIFSK